MLDFSIQELFPSCRPRAAESRGFLVLGRLHLRTRAFSSSAKFWARLDADSLSCCSLKNQHAATIDPPDPSNFLGICAHLGMFPLILTYPYYDPF